MTNNTVKIDFNNQASKADEIRATDIELGMRAYEKHTKAIKLPFYKKDVLQNFIAMLVLLPVAFVFIKGLQALSLI